jgi:K+-sensing histidine kinase KdpD
MTNAAGFVRKVSENELLQKQRESFVASLSHDLKNPTIAQIRAIELLLKGSFGQISSEQREIIQMVLDSCRYMKAMLVNILTTYKNEKGTISLKNEKLSVAELAAECVSEMIYLAKDKNVNLIYKNISDNEYVYGDMIQIRRVIVNLLSNSIKYAYADTDLFVTVYNENNYTCFKFRNKSPYIPPEKQSKLFSQYISYGNTGNLDNIGLGLYASGRIIEAHNGILFLKSFKEEFNEFGFKLPNDEKFKNAKRRVIFD